MFNPCRSSAQGSSAASNIPITSYTPITPSTDPIPIRFPMSPVLGACISSHTPQSGESYKYPCTSCDKVFSTIQALGGHQNAHRKERDAVFAGKQQRAAEENDRDRDVVLSPNPIRWAYPDSYYYVNAEIITNTTTAGVNTNNNNNNKMCAYEFFHFMGMAGDCNPKQAGFVFGSSSGGGHGGASGSGTKRPPEGDGDGPNQKKKAKYYGEADDLKVVLPSVNLSLATECGCDDLIDEIEGSDSDLEWEDREYMYFYQGGGARTSKTEELDLSLKL